MATRKEKKAIQHRSSRLPDGSEGNEVTLAAEHEYAESVSVADIILLKEHYPNEAAKCAQLFVERAEIDNNNLKQDGIARRNWSSAFMYSLYSGILAKNILLIFMIIITTFLYLNDNSYFPYSLGLTAAVEIFPQLGKLLSKLIDRADKKQE